MKQAAALLLLALTACSKEAPLSPDLAVSKQMIWDSINRQNSFRTCPATAAS